MTGDPAGADRRERLGASRLYLVCGVPGDPPDAGLLPDLLRAAVAGGTDIVQLREKRLGDEELTPVAHAVRALCERIGALFIVNDRPAVAAEVQADGVHVGQDDMPVDEVRAIVGPEMLIGLSTHAESEIDAVDPALVDYIGVGPVHETPTKEGRRAVGVDLVRYAVANARVPFFAIGGLNAGNLAEVTGVGATRAVVLRAIADADDPEAAARELREKLSGAGEAA
jgi:thiamine-phosphate pyrophosphorylase